MAVSVFNSTLPGGVTPVCNDCGVALCYDISEFDYEAEKAFWDAWRCQDCNPDAVGSRKRWREEQGNP